MDMPCLICGKKPKFELNTYEDSNEKTYIFSCCGHAGFGISEQLAIRAWVSTQLSNHIELRSAAQQVVGSWETNKLAEAVRNLQRTIDNAT